LRCTIGGAAGAGEVLAETKIKGPIEGNPDLLFKSRQFAQIDSPPQPPGEEAREVDAENIGNPGAPANGGQPPQRREAKRLFVTTVDVGDDVARHRAPLANRMLSSRRLESTIQRVRDQGAIAHGP